MHESKESLIDKIRATIEEDNENQLSFPYEVIGYPTEGNTDQRIMF